ncbi:MAG: thiolase domain-containing protein [Candidatus Dojkabacteria bacterium]
MNKVHIIGSSMTQFGELWDMDIADLAYTAASDALADSGIDVAEVDAIIVANMEGGSFSGQDHIGALLSGDLGLNVPALRVEAACASGSIAINQAFLGILSGEYTTVLVVGVEKMTDVSGAGITKVLARASDEDKEAFWGVTFPSLYAMMAREYMRRYRVTRSDLAGVSVKNHVNGQLNEKAQFQKEISVEDVLNAPDVAEPLGLLDCSPVSDGAAAILLSSRKSQVELVASKVATDKVALHDRESFTSIKASKIAAESAYNAAGISSDDIDVAEVHDCFSIAEIIAYEDLGFANQGEGVKQLAMGKFNRDGKLPINTSGGLKACGHPVGATGVKQAHEIYQQLAGKAGRRQLKTKLNHGLTHNVGGSGGTSVVNIFKTNT